MSKIRETIVQNKSNKEKFLEIVKLVEEASELTDSTIIVIGGVATYLYSIKSEIDDEIIEFSHDGDFVISNQSLDDLQEYYGIANKNMRLKKHELKINDVDYDLYAEDKHTLLYSYKEMNEHSELIGTIRVPCIEHLIKLKTIAYNDRKSSAKGEKDKRDIIRLMYSANNELLDYEVLLEKKFELPKIIDELTEITKDNKAFNELCNNNHYYAAQLKKECNMYLLSINSVLENKLRLIEKLKLYDKIELDLSEQERKAIRLKLEDNSKKKESKIKQIYSKFR